MSAELHRGSPSMRDWTPAADVSAGDIVDIGGQACVLHRDIAANELGAAAVASNQAAYRVTLAAGAVIADGAAVTVDPATGETGGTLHFGYAEGNWNQANGDTFAVVSHAGVKP